MDDREQVRYWGPTNAWRHGTKCARPDDLAPEIFAPQVNDLFLRLIGHLCWLNLKVHLVLPKPAASSCPKPDESTRHPHVGVCFGFLEAAYEWVKYVSKIKEGWSQRRGREGTILCIRGLPVLRLGEETGCRNWSLSWFPSASRRILWDNNLKLTYNRVFIRSL